MLIYYFIGLLNAGLCLQIYFFPIQGLIPIFFPTFFTALMALWYISGISICAPYIDPRGREFDLTFRSLQVIIEGCPPGCTCGVDLASKESIPGIIQVTPSETPSLKFDFCLFVNCNCISSQQQGCLHDLTNIAMANKAIAIITLANPMIWKQALESLIGRVQYIPKNGVLFSLNHPAVRRIILGGRQLKRGVKSNFILAHSKKTLAVEDSSIFINWGTRPHIGPLEVYEFFTIPTRIFTIMFTIITNRGYSWIFLIYVPILVANLLRFCHYILNEAKRKFHKNLPNHLEQKEQCNVMFETTLHGHQFVI